jgi:hypothetical protein
MGMGDQRHAPADLPPEMARLGGPQGPFGRVRKILPLTAFDPRTYRNLKLTSHHSEAKNAWNYTSSTPPRLHAVVLMEQGTKT